MKPQGMQIPARSSPPFRRRIGVLAALTFCALSAQAQTDQMLPATGGPGGGQYAARCAAGEILTGFDLRTGDDVDAIQPLCTVPRGPGEAGPIQPYPAKFGGNGGGARRLICPGNTPLVVGMAVAAEGVKTVIVNNIHLFCGAALAGQAPAANPTVMFDGPPAQYSDAIIFETGNIVQHYDSEGTQTCPAGLVAVGINGRSGKWLDAVGLICGAPPAMAQVQAVPANVTPGNVGKPPVSLGRKRTVSSQIMQRADSHVPIDAGTTSRTRQQRDPPVCASARNARATNSPAAQGLEKQCEFARAHAADAAPRPVQ